MALNKKIGLGNGVVVNYHRVVRVDIVTNQQNTIEVASYTSKTKRAEEVAAIESGTPMNVYIDTLFFDAPYDQSMTVESAYEWLKANRPEFEGARDIFEEDDDGGGGDPGKTM